MVTTRRGAHSTPVVDDSSSGDTDIPAEPVRRRQQPTGKPATLRPSRDSAESHANPGKRKLPVGLRTGALHQPKRVKEEPAVKETIEVQADDDEVDAVLNATTVRCRRIEIPLRTLRGRWADDEVAPANDRSKPSTTQTRGPRLRARRLNRHVRSVEVTGRPADSEALGKTTRSKKLQERVAETPEPESHQREDEEPPVGPESPAEFMGSPELQSSALKRRRARPTDVYDFFDASEPPTPAPRRNPKSTVGSRSPRRVEPSKKTAQARFLTSRNIEKLSSISEKNHPPAVTSDEDEWPIQDGDEPEASDEVAESEDSPWEELESEDEAGAGQTAGSQSNSVPIQIKPYVRSTQTIIVPGGHLRGIFVIMGRRGWTGAGNRWGHELLRCARDPRRLARLGKEGIEALVCLRDILEDTPNALDLSAQSRSLAEQEQALNDAVKDIEKLMAKLGRRAASARRAARGRMDPDRPGSLASDLYSFVIPMLVLVLRSCYNIGVQEPDAEAGSALADEAAFTGASIQLLLRLIWWLICLQRLLEEHFSPVAADNEGPGIGDRRDPEDPEQNRVEAGKLFKAWTKLVQLKVDAFNEQASRERDLYEKKKRDEEIRRAREREEEARLAEARRLDEAWKRSIELATNKPRPNELLWREHWPALSSSIPQSSIPGSSSNPSRQVRPTTTSRSTNSSRPPSPPPLSISSSPSSSSSSSAFAPLPQQQQPAPSSRAAPAAAAPPAPAPTPAPAPAAVRAASPVLDDAPWPELDTEWLLEQMAAPDRTEDDVHVWAETLYRTVEEVVAEMRRLKRVGRYRSPKLR